MPIVNTTLPALRTLKICEVHGQASGIFEGLCDAIDAPRLDILMLRNFEDEDVLFLSTPSYLESTKSPALRTLLVNSLAKIYELSHAFPRVETVLFDADSGDMLDLLYDISRSSWLVSPAQAGPPLIGLLHASP